MLDSKENFSRWSQFLRYHLKAKTHDRDKEQTGRSPGKKPDRQAEPGSQHETDRVTVIRNQEADTIRKLAGEANNINQLAHRANAGGFALVAVELVKLKNRIVEIINQLSDDWKNKKGKRI